MLSNIINSQIYIYNLKGLRKKDLLPVADLLISSQIYAWNVIRSDKKRFAITSLYFCFKSEAKNGNHNFHYKKRR